MTKLKLYNTLSQQKESFKPLTPGKVKMYVCGVTVYDHCHIGHARVYVAFDIIRRYLEHLNFEVTYIQNFTDIDDKIIKRANEQNRPYQEVVDTHIQSYFEDMDKLNIKQATAYPKATEHIDSIQTLIQTLIEKEYAYISHENVYFDIQKAKDYGKLSKKIIEELEAGNRVEVSENKHNPLDFVLWKAAKPHEPAWDSPWGKGRPGWHIECSAMVNTLLGPSIDIHGGGQDLIFPHHENEICQSEHATGKPLATYWLHNGFVTIKDEKMSKSLNNFFTLKETLKAFSGQTIRFFLMKTHYRSPLNFSHDGLKEAQIALHRLQNTLKNTPDTAAGPNTKNQLDTLAQKWTDAMNDDFNYAEAIGYLFEMNKLINHHQEGKEYLQKYGTLLGLFYDDQSTEKKHPQEDQIEALIQERTVARKAKDFKKSDDIRDQLLNKFKVQLEDTASGTRWENLS